MSLGIPRFATPPQNYYSAGPEPKMMMEEDGGAAGCSSPCGDCPPATDYYGSGSFTGFTTDPVRYFNGEIKFIANDLSSDGFGVPWGHTRSYSNQLTNQADGTNGNSWRVAEWPYIVETTPTSVCVVAGTIYDAVWFDLVQDNYIPRFAVPATLMHDTANQQYIYTNAKGFITKFFDYSSSITPALQGQFKSFTDLSGIETFPTYDPKTNLITSFVRQAQNASSGFYYTYYTEGDNAGQLQYVTVMVNGLEVRRACYTYYGADELYGNLNDLKLVAIQEPSGGNWSNLKLSYCRYYKADEVYGFPYGLKFLVGPQSYTQIEKAGIDPETATNSEIAQFSDMAFQYDLTTQAAIAEKTMGGKRKFKFSYTNSNFPQSFNNWAVKTAEILPNKDQNIVFTNFAGQVMLSIRQSGQQQWFAANQYDNNGLVVLSAKSSAVAGYDETQPNLVQLQPDSGMINSYVYYPQTNIAAGAVANFMQYRQVQQGSEGEPILLNQYQYTSRTSGSTTIYLLAKDICYLDADDPLIQLLCHIYSYTWQGNTLQMAQKITTFPVVPTSQNGSGVADSKQEAYDAYGNATWFMDERGYLTNQTYDIATGTVIQRIQDVDTNIVQGAPAGWVTPPGGGLNLVTDYTVDGLGRTTQELGPLHDIDLNGINTTLRRATWTVYQDAIFQVWRGSGYGVPATSGYDFTLVNPVKLTFVDRANRTTDEINAVRSSTEGPLSASDSFPQFSWISWKHKTYKVNVAPAFKRVYFLIPASGHGLRGVNYNQTNYDYDRMQQRIRRKRPGGTITWTIYNPMGWVIETWVGTNDNGATVDDPSGGRTSGNNMVRIQTSQYDNDTAGGDGNLTQQSQYTDAQSARVTTYEYDFRNRRTIVDGEIDLYQVSTYDNLDRVIQIEQYDTAANGNLISRKALNFDNRARVYQTICYGVDPATGIVGAALTDNGWYDPSSSVIEISNAGSCLSQKIVYDGINRVTAQYQSYNVNQAGYPYPVDVSQDTVFEQTEVTYDDASNVIQQTVRERFHNATGPGALTSPTGPQPQARVNYMAIWPDPLDRPHNTANYGTNQGVALNRPDTAPDSSSTVLVTTTDYNDAGQAYQVTDPLGIIRFSTFDAASRLTQLIENYAPDGTNPDQNKETDYAYTADSKVGTLTAINNVTGNQVTQYIYGTTLDNSDIASNELLRTVIYPDDGPTTPDRVTMSYNRLGQVINKQDQLGTMHAITYDLLGRQISDSITTLGAGVDGAVRQIAQTYEVRGMVQNITSYDSANGGNVVNDVLMVYDQFSQLSTQSQSHAGATSPNSPTVQYGYADGSANTVRPISLIYPSGRELNFNYGSAGQANDLLSRIGALVDDDGSTQLAAYTYVGLKRIVQVNSPQPGTMLTYIQQGANNPPLGSGGDQYTGWDQFNRVVDQRWLNAAEVDIERCQFGYNQANNKLWRKDVVAQTAQDEFYTYDGLSQLTDFQRGTLNGTNTGLIGVPAWEEDFTFDPTGNWQNYVNQVNGLTTLNQPRTHNPANEIMTISGSNLLITQDAAGNIAKAPQPSNWGAAYNMVYDAWNRLVQVKNGSAPIATYAYDGQNWRVSKTANGVTSDYYYTSRWQIVEEQVGGSLDRQHIWGLLGSVDNLVLRERPALSERFYALSDQVSVTAITDTTGTVQERYGYNAYGAPQFMTASFSPQPASQYAWETLYDSYRWDDDTGYYQVRNRYLHTTLGRWLTRDPIGYEGGINLYAYCFNDGINRVDPEGLDCPGCDGVSSIPGIGFFFTHSHCALRCCAVHDECYYDNCCDSSSWFSLSACQGCNADVVGCMILCLASFGFYNNGAPTEYFCAATGQYITIGKGGTYANPGDADKCCCASDLC